jgi:hypothetical protein
MSDHNSSHGFVRINGRSSECLPMLRDRRLLLKLEPHFHYVYLGVDTGATASAGAGAACMDEPKGLIGFAMIAGSIVRAR